MVRPEEISGSGPSGPSELRFSEFDPCPPFALRFVQGEISGMDQLLGRVNPGIRYAGDADADREPLPTGSRKRE